MRRLLVTVALLAACRGRHHDDAGSQGSASPVSAAVSKLVPHLPVSADGVLQLKELDKRILVHRAETVREIGLLLERAAITGQLEDYQQALALSEQAIAATPADPTAWKTRVFALARVHEFTGARAALDKLRPLVTDPGELAELEATIDEATGQTERVLAHRAAMVKANPSTNNLVMQAASLGADGRLDEALAEMPSAVAALHDNTTERLAWILFQWGRLYEQKGETAAARELFAAAHARLPGSLEPITHLAQALIATGDRGGARTLVDEALAGNPHPELQALAAELEPAQAAERIAAARAGWDRYLAAFPLAFSDHAARFFLGVGADPKRALELARANLANRDTHEARALVVDAALAAGDAAAACAVVDPLRTGGTRAQRFTAWRALARCGRTSDADRLAQELGITH